MLAVLIVLSLLASPGLHDGLDPIVKGPWYFLGLQEILHWTPWPNAVVAGMVAVLAMLFVVRVAGASRARVVKSVLAVVAIGYAGLCATGAFMRGENWAWGLTWPGATGNPRLAWVFASTPGTPSPLPSPLPTVMGRPDGCLVCHRGVTGLERPSPGSRRLRVVPRRRCADARQGACARGDGRHSRQSRQRATAVRPVRLPRGDRPARRAVGHGHDERRRGGHAGGVRRRRCGSGRSGAPRGGSRLLRSGHASAPSLRAVPSRPQEDRARPERRGQLRGRVQCLPPVLRPAGAGRAECLRSEQGGGPGRTAHPASGDRARYRQRPVLRLPQPVGAHFDELRGLARDARATGIRERPHGCSSTSSPTFTTSAASTASTATLRTRRWATAPPIAASARSCASSAKTATRGRAPRFRPSRRRNSTPNPGASWPCATGRASPRTATRARAPASRW